MLPMKLKVCILDHHTETDLSPKGSVDGAAVPCTEHHGAAPGLGVCLEAGSTTGEPREAFCFFFGKFLKKKKKNDWDFLQVCIATLYIGSLWTLEWG